ncbi:hypothetical protein [Aestuariivivens sediminis]|uniref:hypothetical protein n=1 Tax=Aestuariivivens sediminis TaxID=2913557 RepID=UPI001F57E1E1|nr:hypothetical protein [Aestuariivivens sediminis]
MKTIKSFSLLIALALMLSSCLLLSLHPYYTNDLIHFEEQLIGKWADTANGSWKILGYKDFMLSESKKSGKEINTLNFNKNELEVWHNAHLFYAVQYKADAKSRDTLFHLAVPFKIDDQLFLDYTPLQQISNSKVPAINLYNNHKIDVHALAKVDIHSNNNISITWLGDEKFSKLLASNKIKIKHETPRGFISKIVLTASSEELVKFLEKYMNSKDGDQRNFNEQGKKLIFNLKRR